jgi:maltooligosyltrehalose trehalohydrolase
MIARVHSMPFGARLLRGGGARFRLWAPAARTVDLVCAGGPLRADVPMQARPGGWFECEVGKAGVATRYAFRIDGGLTVPDPASRCNPDDVHAPSALVDPAAFDWPDAGWRGRPWEEAVVYELHVGAFTPQGTFAAAIERLDDLARLGVTALEVMPVADFPGRRNWGYDGVLPFAPDASYGTPEDFKRLVAAAHARGLMVLLDVVYNHFGPDGNYLHVYAPQFFDPARTTPWGAAIDFDGPASRTVRDFFIHNALYWLQEFHLDGLRLDAVHAIDDRSPLHFVAELAQAVRAGPGRERHVHLLLENDRNEARFLARAPDGAVPLATAQCNDDVHHALHVLATGETDGYYADYAVHPAWLLGRALAEGFAFQGDASAYRGGTARGEPSLHLPPTAFVNFLQTHDQVGNRAFGERIAMLADAAALRALAACVLLAPSPPLLFMGEEFAAGTPFLYFCDFHDDLAAAVREGRRSEFARFARFADPALRSRIPDPNEEQTFAASRLDWSERERSPHRDWLALYARLLALRHARLVPHLAGASRGSYHVLAPGRLAVHWPLAGGRHWHLLANLDADAAMLAPLPPGEVVYASHPFDAELPPWSVRVTLEDPAA